jgi:signal transduction histidine kinase
MATLPAFFLRYLDVIYLLYGLALFTMGVVVWLEASRPTSLPLARPLPFLALFGILHGFHEWGEWFVPIHQASHPIPLLADLTLLALAFFLLAEFGLRLLSLDGWPSAREARLTLGLLFLVGEGIIAVRWGGKPDFWVPAADAWARYALAIPAALLAAVGLCRHSRCLTRAARGPAADLRWAGLALALYAVPGQVFVAAGPLPPSNWLNDIFFLRTFGIPIQLWRAVMAGLVALFTVRALRLFEEERARQMEELTRARLEAQQRLQEEAAQRETMRQEFTRRLVWAQEEERRYIARELHDEIGQACTALRWELTALEQTLPEEPPHREIRARIQHLHEITDRAMENLYRMVNRLRPAALDRLGLIPALITYADECSARYPFVVEVEILGPRRRFPERVETVLYRVAQEAITNVARHARATRVRLTLAAQDHQVCLTVADDGVGIDPETVQQADGFRKGGGGLTGIRERVQLMGGRAEICSTPGAGTVLTVCLPLEEESDEHPSSAGG